jgi:hypothetical protein
MNTDNPDNDEGFEQWLRKVNYHLIQQCGMVSDDLPDRPYRDMYEGGDSPEDAATEALEYAKES